MSDNSEVVEVVALRKKLVDLALEGDRQSPDLIDREVGVLLEQIVSLVMAGLLGRLKEEVCELFDELVEVAEGPIEGNNS